MGRLLFGDLLDEERGREMRELSLTLDLHIGQTARHRGEPAPADIAVSAYPEGSLQSRRWQGRSGGLLAKTHQYFLWADPNSPRSESYRVSRRPHFLGGWGLWDVQVGFLRRCARVPSGWSRSTGRPTPQSGRCCSRWRRSSAARRRRCGSGCGRRSVMRGIGRA